jgi:hypothetical protein
MSKQKINSIVVLDKEAQDLLNENERLKGYVHALRRELTAVSSNIDISTINQSKRSQERWGYLRTVAFETLAACPEPKRRGGE